MFDGADVADRKITFLMDITDDGVTPSAWLHRMLKLAVPMAYADEVAAPMGASSCRVTSLAEPFKVKGELVLPTSCTTHADQAQWICEEQGDNLAVIDCPWINNDVTVNIAVSIGSSGLKVGDDIVARPNVPVDGRLFISTFAKKLKNASKAKTNLKREFGGTAPESVTLPTPHHDTVPSVSAVAIGVEPASSQGHLSIKIPWGGTLASAAQSIDSGFWLGVGIFNKDPRLPGNDMTPVFGVMLNHAQVTTRLKSPEGLVIDAGNQPQGHYFVAVGTCTGFDASCRDGQMLGVIQAVDHTNNNDVMVIAPEYFAASGMMSDSYGSASMPPSSSMMNSVFMQIMQVDTYTLTMRTDNLPLGIDGDVIAFTCKGASEPPDCIFFSLSQAKLGADVNLDLPISSAEKLSVWVAIIVKTDQGPKLVGLANVSNRIGLVYAGAVVTRTQTVVISPATTTTTTTATTPPVIPLPSPQP